MFNGLKRGIVICACAALAVSCMDYGPIEKEDFEIDNAGSGDEVSAECAGQKWTANGQKATNQ